MNHLEIYAIEITETTYDSKFADWLANIADSTGLTAEYGDGSLDGDRSADNPNPDPACLDELAEWFNEDMTIMDAVEIIESRKLNHLWRA